MTLTPLGLHERPMAKGYITPKNQDKNKNNDNKTTPPPQDIST